MADLLTSAEVAARLGVGVSAVKRWAESGALPCIKTPGGHRRFTLVAIETFRAANAGETASDAWAPWLSAIDAGSNSFELMARLCDARAQSGSWQQVMTLVGELLTELGDRWTRGEVSVAQEHVASAAVTRALAQIAETLPVGRVAPRVVLACADGELHTLGLSMADVCAREAGWATVWLGAPTETEHILEHLRDRDVQAVAVSASMHSSNTRALARQAKRVGEACRQARVPLIVGGRGAWPDQLPYGKRLHDWEAFQRTLTGLPTSTDR
jgi:excisionase family DNA binding protein